MIRMDGKYRTRDGHEVRLYAIDGAGAYPVHGAILSKPFNGWVSNDWNIIGKPADITATTIDLPNDLIEIKPAAIDRLMAQLESELNRKVWGGEGEDAIRNTICLARRIKAEMEDVG